MHEASIVRRALQMLDAGATVSAVARDTGVSPSTVRAWRDVPDRLSARVRHCPRCGTGALDENAYAYLLGAYLGDGTLSVDPRGVARLRIVQTAIYPDLITELRSAAGLVLPNRVGIAPRQGCVEVYAYSKHWPCLFPQHGSGPKHDRLIELADWQRDVVSRAPKQLLRGLIHSDGCRSINTIKHGDRVYRYPRYQFTNVSTDILGIFTDTCDALGVHWTRMNRRNIAVSRRDDVRFLDSFIGPKT